MTSRKCRSRRSRLPASQWQASGPAAGMNRPVPPRLPAETDDEHSPPRTGRALFAWTKEQDGKFEYGLLKHLNAWAKSQEFPPRMVDWDAEQVSRAHAEARRNCAVQGPCGTEAVLAN